MDKGLFQGVCIQPVQKTGLANHSWQTNEDPHKARRRHPLLLQEVNGGANELQSPGEVGHRDGHDEGDPGEGAGWRTRLLGLEDGNPGEKEWKG